MNYLGLKMIKMYKKFTLAILLLLSGLFTAHAVEVDNLYQVKYLVSDQSQTTRWNMAVQGLKEVLVRKTGGEAILAVEGTENAISKVTTYLQKYQYKQEPMSPDSNRKALFLQLDFEPRLIDDLIKSSGIPIWGNNRPVTIMWLAIEEDFKRSIVSDSHKDISQLMSFNATRRGIPVVLPLMDIEDSSAVTVTDVWGKFDQVMIDGSKRYAADAVVTGRLFKQYASWHAQLSYINGDVKVTFDLEAEYIDDLIIQLIDQLTGFLCDKYCVAEIGETNKVIFQLTDVNNFKEMVSVKSYLSKLTSVRQVEIKKISGINLMVEVTLLGDIESVKTGIRFDERMVELDSLPADPFREEIEEIRKQEQDALSAALDDARKKLAEAKKIQGEALNVDSGETGIGIEQNANNSAESITEAAINVTEQASVIGDEVQGKPEAAAILAETPEAMQARIEALHKKIMIISYRWIE
ncbi:MAG: DUF2066 domain-containing protein [Gammaproteobacteria bacterium]|nr:DUF2066 domain-containing protein [Gammaproteobacteria bacterium]